MRVLGIVLTIAVLPAPAGATGPVIAAAPGSYNTGYNTPAPIAISGTLALFATQDIQPHNVVSVLRGPDSAPWCGLPNLPSAYCPAFASDTFTAGAGEVFGVGALEPGTYGFFCKIHPITMRGELTVL